MNIGNFPIISNNITNRITTGAPQTGFQSDSDAVWMKDGVVQGSAQLLNPDFSARQGYREDYSIRDAAEYLWRQETQTFNLKDLDDPEKSKEFLENWRMQARWDLGIQDGGPTKDEVISAYIQDLRQNGLDGSVDWSALTRELDAFKATSPEELEDGLDYLASRYVAARDKLERNYTSGELTAQLAKLEEVYQAGKSGMIDGYTQALQDNLGLSNSDAQAVRDSFSSILAEKEEAYRGALKQVHEAVAQTGPDSVWLKDHDAYIASQLRAAGKAGESTARCSVQDLTAAGQIAQDYRAEIDGASSCGRNEVTLGLNLAMADMKAETMISKGLVSDSMAALLRSSRTQGHENALAALDQALSTRESSRASGEPKGTYAPVDSTVFRGIYDAVMSAYRQNGGDAAKAIQAGASAGEKLTAQAAARAPKAARWGVSMKHYLQEFYKAPEEQAVTLLGLQIKYLTNQKSRTSTYQKYVNSWQDFLTSIGGGVNIRA